MLIESSIPIKTCPDAPMETASLESVRDSPKLRLKL